MTALNNSKGNGICRTAKGSQDNEGLQERTVRVLAAFSFEELFNAATPLKSFGLRGCDDSCRLYMFFEPHDKANKCWVIFSGCSSYEKLIFRRRLVDDVGQRRDCLYIVILGHSEFMCHLSSVTSYHEVSRNFQEIVVFQDSGVAMARGQLSRESVAEE